MGISRRRFIETTSGTLAIGVAAAGAALQISAAAQQKSNLTKTIGQNSAQSVAKLQPVPDILAVPAGNELLLRTFGVGVQRYTCPVNPTSAAVPHADLFASDKDEGDLMAIHFAGPTWQALDGSSVVGDAANAKHNAGVRGRWCNEAPASVNMDNCSRYCQAPATTGLFRTVGLGGDSGSIRDIENAGLVLIIGSNTAEAHPVLATRVKQAHKLRGQKLVVADLRKHEMAERADLFFQPKPGTDLVWLSAIARYILDNGLEKKEFLAQWVNDLEDYKKSLELFTMKFAAKTCGLTVELLKQVAHMIVEADGVCILWAMGITQHSMGSDASTAISNLLLVTGNYMRTGTGAYPLRGHNNVQGAGDHGAAPETLPGYQSVHDPEVRARFEAAWNVKLPSTKGLDNHEMIDAIHAGKLKAMYIFGEEIALVDSNANFVQDKLAKLEFFVAQDVFFSKTCQFADVILPASPSLEKEGTFTSTERRIQRLYQVLEPLGESRPDWRIIQDVANHLAANWNYQHPSEIYDEIASLTPLFAGVTYERMEGYKSLQWPVAPNGTDQPLLYTEEFALPGGKARLFPLAMSLPTDPPDEEFDLHLNNGRILEHFHEGNLTYRSNGIREKVPDTWVEVSPALAKERGVQSGTWVQLISRYGKLRVRALVTERVTGKELYMPMNSSESPVNLLTSSYTDAVTDTPAYKEASVRMVVLDEIGKSPLPKVNSRFGHPTPQRGVEVERKWKRIDYEMPKGEPVPHGESIHAAPKEKVISD